MRLPCVQVHKSKAQETIEKMKKNRTIIHGYRVKREGDYVLIPSVQGDTFGDFQEVKQTNLQHVGSFEKIGDFVVIKERDNWKDIYDSIIERRPPRAIYLDQGVKGSERIRDLKLIYGEGEPSSFHRENGIRLWVDLSKAYFSPRLATIREFTAENVMNFPHNRVIDMYAGIGPITILLLKKGIRTYSFDINPEAAKLLKYNLKLNRVEGNIVIADSNKLAECFALADQIIMNNPSQDIHLTENIINGFKGKIVHLFILLEKNDLSKFLEKNGKTEIVREVHGYSPSKSLYYILLRM